MPIEPIRHKKEGQPHITPPITIRQAFASERISQLSTNGSLRDRFLDGLRQVRDSDLNLVDLFTAFGVVTNAAEARHLRSHWYITERKESDRSGEEYWSEDKHIKKEMVDGLISAFQKAKDTDSSVLFFWLIYDEYRDNANPVFSYVDHDTEDNSPASILLMFCTPPPNIPHES